MQPIDEDKFNKLVELSKKNEFNKKDLQFIWGCCCDVHEIYPLTLVAIIDHSPLTEAQIIQGQLIAEKYGLLESK